MGSDDTLIHILKGKFRSSQRPICTEQDILRTLDGPQVGSRAIVQVQIDLYIVFKNACPLEMIYMSQFDVLGTIVGLPIE